jgi:hypothetical protein
MAARAAFYGWRSILSRAWRGGWHWRRPQSIGLMLLANWISRREIYRKQARALSPSAQSAAESASARVATPVTGTKKAIAVEQGA